MKSYQITLIEIFLKVVTERKEKLEEKDSNEYKYLEVIGKSLEDRLENRRMKEDKIEYAEDLNMTRIFSNIFNEEQSRIFGLIIKYKKVKAGSISNSLDMDRGLVYRCLDFLINSGLITSEPYADEIDGSGNGRYFFLIEPFKENLLDYFKQQKNKIEDDAETVFEELESCSLLV